MYLYPYDPLLNNKRYSSLLARIETRLTDLGVGGKIFRLSPLRDTNQLLLDEVKNGVKTVVVVGNDKSFAEIINVAAKLDVTLGIIPVGPGNKIAKILGIGSPEEACNIIAARIVEKVDLGKANGIYFLSSITIAPGSLTLDCENKFRLTPQLQDQISICNLKPMLTSVPHQGHFNPKDGWLEIIIEPAGAKSFFRKATSGQSSVIPFKELAIQSKESLPVLTDSKKILKTPVQIKIVPNKLKVIVGKDRLF